MEVFQNLKILLPENNKEVFFQALKDNIEKSDWIIRNDLMNNYSKNTFTTKQNVLCVESDECAFESKAIQALVWIWDYDGYYEVFNIIPVKPGSLATKEYNYILNLFYEKFILDLAKHFDASITLTKPEKLIVETIGKEAYEALISFSDNANKSSGNTHPYDFQRWCDFIFIIFRESIELSSTELENWFIENGWSDEIASRLALEFEYSISLLKKYEPN